MAEQLNGLSPEIRKLRKKLRQIENLELLERDLTVEEHAKVSIFLQRSPVKPDLILHYVASMHENLSQQYFAVNWADSYVIFKIK